MDPNRFTFPYPSDSPLPEFKNDPNQGNAIVIKMMASPDVYQYVNGSDWLLRYLKVDHETFIEARKLLSLEDLDLNRIDLSELPKDVLDRLREGTRDTVSIIQDNQKFIKEVRILKEKINELKKLMSDDCEQSNALIKYYCEFLQNYKNQKRKIKKLLRENGFKIKPGSELSKTLAISNIPWPKNKLKNQSTKTA